MRVSKRFHQTGIDARAFQTPDFTTMADRCQHHDYSLLDGWIRLDHRRKLSSIYTGHLVIGDHKIVRVAARLSRVKGAKRLLGGGITSIPHPPTGDLLMDYATIDFIVIDDQ